MMSEMSGADGEGAELLALGEMDINSSELDVSSSGVDQEAEDCQRRSAVVIEVRISQQMVNRWSIDGSQMVNRWPTDGQ